MECAKCGKDKDAKLFRHDNGKKSSCMSCVIEYARKTYNPKKSLWFMRKYRYGISKLDFYAMKLRQVGLCAVCLEELPPDNKVHVDHCHKTGEVRGLLCRKCNMAIGYIENHPGIIGNIVDYLE